MNDLDKVMEMSAKVKADSHLMAALPIKQRNEALVKIKDALRKRSDEIFAANLADLVKAREDKLPDPLVKRLLFDDSKLDDAISGIESLINLPDPLFKTMMKRELDQGLLLHQISCPIGVIGVIFESRPDALIQIATLCLKSGNCAILKGGSEAAGTNRILYEIISEAALETQIPAGFLTLVENRSHIDSLLKCHEYIDLIIPRGSNEFVQYIMANSKIPVMGHADGVCHIYVDENYDKEKAIPIIVDAKTQYVAACNTLETLLVHEKIAGELMPDLVAALKNAKVKVKGSPEIAALAEVEPTSEADWDTEYLDMILSIKTVKDLDEAIAHINKHGSHHTDAIISEDVSAVEKFMLYVDSAGVYHNCSTRFADGYRYGLGAEVGISTGKLHARGPVGLEGLVTYKYRLSGKGQIVKDYAEGIKTFKFKDL